MLTCIPCSKQLGGGSIPQHDDDDAVTTPNTKQAIKTLSSQIKDIAIKASEAYRSCKPCSGSTTRSQSQKRVDSDAASVSDRFHGSYQRAGSTPRPWGKGMEERLKGLSSGEGTPVSVSGRTESSIVFMEEDDEPKEWVAQVEPGVLITFVTLSEGGNDLKRIRFSREMFNKWQAQRWWSENYEKVMELYNVQRLNHQAVPLQTPARSEDEGSKIGSAEGSPATPPLSKERTPRNFNRPTGVAISSSDSLDHHRSQHHRFYDAGGLASTPKLSSISGAKTDRSSLDASVRSSSSREVDHSGEFSMSNASDLDTEWVEQDEPGVYITIRAVPGGTRELRRVRFSREKFGETQARQWWEQNRARIQEQYL